MRFVVLLFGLLASFLTALLGGMLLTFNATLKLLVEWEVAQYFEFLYQYDTKNPSVTGLFLCIAAGFGFLGAIFGFLRCGWQGALLMLVPVAGPALINPATLAVTGLQIIAAFMSFFVRPLPIVPQEE